MRIKIHLCFCPSGKQRYFSLSVWDAGNTEYTLPGPQKLSESTNVKTCSCCEVCVRVCNCSLCAPLLQTEMAMYKEVCYYMLFAMAAYGWPMYLLRNATCGVCRLLSSCT